MMNNIINFICFQIGWFSAVMSAANKTPWLGVIVIMIIIAVHLFRQKNPFSELILILSIGLLGGILDSIFVYFQWISYPSGHIHENLTAYWIIAMWMSFATTLNISMAWLKNKNILGFIFGFLAEKSGNISPIKIKSQQYNKLLAENTIRTQCMDPTLNPEYVF